MRSIEVIREILAMRGWSQAKLAQECGYKRQSNIAAILTRNTDMKVCNLVELSEAMGFEVIVRDKMGSKQEYRITDKRGATE